ncbi:MAG: ExeM/NucH family extracellular endonuclease [Frankiaceae bacterium]|nr:ExeM/NucH family extracellular endonuclease [Arenimonas sp.]
MAPKLTVSLLALACALSLSACQAATDPTASPDSRGAAGRDVPQPGLLAIGEVQGSGVRSPLVDRQVSIKGVVVGNFAKGLQGVFVQSERDDGDPLTAEGIFIERDGNAEPLLHRGDRVRVSGRVAEMGDGDATLTALRDSVLEVIGRGQVEATVVSDAPATAGDWERYEGMQLRITAPLTVTGNGGVAEYGEIATSFGGRLFQPTEIALPGPAAQAVQQDNARRLLLLDDNRTSKNPRNLWFLAQGLDDAHPLRAGSVLRGVSGVLDQRRGRYRLQLTDKLDVTQAARPELPQVAGDVRIASLNLLNLFNGDGRGAGYPTERGAETADQHAEQQRKLVAVVQALRPDIAALMEVENDGSGEDSALAQFVAELNATGPLRDFRIVDAGGKPGDDGIRVAIIYRSGTVKLQGRAALLRGGPFAGRSRVPMAQAFRAGRGPVFVVTANHFKSKGCGRDDKQARGSDADQHDGQGCWNAARVESARLLDAWLATDPTRSGSKLGLLVGDLNAHAQEDPLRLLRGNGWRDAFGASGKARPYSFNFDDQAGRLDHALLTPALAARLRGAVEWHINSDEVPVFDYHDNRDGDPYRASDHDPVLLGFDLAHAGL